MGHRPGGRRRGGTQKCDDHACYLNLIAASPPSWACLSDAEYLAGLARLRAAACREAGSAPVVDVLDLVVLR